jgi:hypothetical protein
MQIQILRRTCDNPRCPHNSSIDLTVPSLKPDMESALSNWVILTKEHVLQSGQAPQGLTKQGCCAGCAMEIIRNGLLELPKLPSVPLTDPRKKAESAPN